ncbi:hypothetical protein EYF80_007497 [Liparis tanakae]|uniref:Uncharacterized protein n=1 Tax=Liparis tanakae TaxID=230148 RepID=A0A4Z2IWX6_9TELE|nr:hypothetical protein EYF80_007497 [Liparis tanakae]
MKPSIGKTLKEEDEDKDEDEEEEGGACRGPDIITHLQAHSRHTCRRFLFVASHFLLQKLQTICDVWTLPDCFFGLGLLEEDRISVTPADNTTIKVVKTKVQGCWLLRRKEGAVLMEDRHGDKSPGFGRIGLELVPAMELLGRDPDSCPLSSTPLSLTLTLTLSLALALALKHLQKPLDALVPGSQSLFLRINSHLHLLHGLPQQEQLLGLSLVLRLKQEEILI